MRTSVVIGLLVIFSLAPAQAQRLEPAEWGVYVERQFRHPGAIPVGTVRGY